MKKILILFLLIIKPVSAGSLLSKCFKSKSKPKVELTNSSQIENIANIQEQNAQERNRLLAKYLHLDEKDNFSEIRVFKVLEPLKIEKLEISPEEATEKLKILYKETYDSKWHKFRQEAATLINSGANPNIDKYSSEQHSLLNAAVLYQDYFFAYFLLKREARINEYTLPRAKSLKMTELLISYGANPKETEWFGGNPLMNTIVHSRDSNLLFFYVDKFKYSVNEKYYQERGNLLHMLFRVHKFYKDEVIIFLSLGVNPFEKNDQGETPIHIAKKYLESDNETTKQKGQEFLDGVEEYVQIFRETLIEETKDTLPLELQDYIYKFHAGEDAELFESKIQ